MKIGIARWFAIVLMFAGAPAGANPGEDLRAMADRHATEILRQSPELATMMGVPESTAGEGFQARLSDLSPKANADARQFVAQLLAELETIDQKQLTGRDQITYEVMHFSYRLAVAQNRFASGHPSLLSANPPYAVNQLFGPQIDLPRLLTTQHPLRTQRNIADWFQRLASIPRVLRQLSEMSEADAKRGIIPPRFTLASVADAADRWVSGPTSEHPLLNAFVERLSRSGDLSAAERDEHRVRAEQLLEQEVIPAYQDFARRLRTLIPKSPAGAGLWRLEDGEAMYEVALEAWGADGLSADAIHQLGLDDVARIQREMDPLLIAAGYRQGTVGERMSRLAQDPRYLIEDTDQAKSELIDQLQQDVAEVLELAPKWFINLPDYAVEVRRIPEHEQDNASGGYYTPPPLDGSRPGIFWVNLKNARDVPIYTLKSLVMHEAVPGHHFQAGRSLSIRDLPLIQNLMWFGDYGEGWALYAEQLAHEMGVYENDPLANLGRYRMELYRAARLVVDTGLHHKRWSRKEAVDYMVGVTGESVESITREIDRYAVWPGQAASYKLGMIQLQRLRERARSKLGSRFDIRQFHDVVLRDGAMPMATLAGRVDRWIEATLELPLLPRDCEKSLALSAAPEYLRAGAGVMVLNAAGYTLLRKPTNAFTCIVNRDHPRVLKPTCFDAEGTASVIPKIQFVGQRILAGDSVATINQRLDTAFADGTFRSQQRPGVAYMLSRYNRPVNRQTGELGFFPPHVMFHAPNLTNADIGHDMSHHDPNRPLPMIAYGGRQGYMIMISDDGAPRRREDLHASCPDWIWQ